MLKNELVSVIVISYNAENTILETLESIKNQTYQNIELIVSDDCSKDRTVEICKKWINENKERFVNTQLLTVKQNTGVCANGNRGRFAATGKWLKGIASDDILLPNCIKDYMDFIAIHPQAKFLSAFRRVYNETFEEKNFIFEDKGIGDNSIYEEPIEEQLRIGARRLLAQGCVMFYAKEVFETVGGFHPEYPFEDYPFQIDALEHGYKIYLVPKTTVGYRIHQSICHENSKLYNAKFKKLTRPFFEARCFKYLTKKQIIAERLIWKLDDFLEKYNLNKKNTFSNYVYHRMIAVIRNIYK